MWRMLPLSSRWAQRRLHLHGRLLWWLKPGLRALGVLPEQIGRLEHAHRSCRQEAQINRWRPSNGLEERIAHGGELRAGHERAFFLLSCGHRVLPIIREALGISVVPEVAGASASLCRPLLHFRHNARQGDPNRRLGREKASWSNAAIKSTKKPRLWEQSGPRNPIVADQETPMGTRP
jgi:hypothetical protein